LPLSKTCRRILLAVGRDDVRTALLTWLCEQSSVVAVWEDGSGGADLGDDLSDVDLGVAVEDSDLAHFLDEMPDLLRRAVDAVLVRTFGHVATIVTPDWTRADVAVRARSATARGVPGPVTVLYDPTGFVRMSDGVPLAATDRITDLIVEFLRCVGLLPIATKRGESIGGYVATGAMVGMLTELMQIENGTLRVGGALRLGGRLTPDQHEELAALPPLVPTTASVRDVHLELARRFLPRARRVAASTGVAYPDHLEDALLQHLSRHGFALTG